MKNSAPIPPKPRSERVRPEITRLPRLTRGRRLARRLLRGLLRLLVWLFIRLEVRGIENYPHQGAALVVANHLGDADGLIGVVISSRSLDLISKAELYDFPILGRLMRAYGVVWVHRGRPDRRALRAALQGLAQGRMVCLAPEGRESLTGGLEEGTHGAAYLALKSQAPILPITFTGTENWRIYGNMKRLRRTRVTITMGPLFRLPQGDNWRATVEEGTQIIMQTLASQLPPEYQGVYCAQVEATHGR